MTKTLVLKQWFTGTHPSIDTKCPPAEDPIATKRFGSKLYSAAFALRKRTASFTSMTVDGHGSSDKRYSMEATAYPRSRKLRKTSDSIFTACPPPASVHPDQQGRVSENGQGTCQVVVVRGHPHMGIAKHWQMLESTFTRLHLHGLTQPQVGLNRSSKRQQTSITQKSIGEHSIVTDSRLVLCGPISSRRV